MDVDNDSRFMKVTTARRNTLLGELEGRVRSTRGFAVATINLDHIVKLRRDTAFRAAYSRHSHVVADGNPVVWLHRLAGRPVDLITGSDLVDPLMELARQHRVPVAFVGSTKAALDEAAQRLLARHPGLVIAARISPEFGFDPTGQAADECIRRIGASGARLCLVAFGAPKQELFVARAVERLPWCGFVSVGAGLDFIAGTQRRAPELFRRLALEWLWRLARDPVRLARRYIDCAFVLPELVLEALRARFGNRPRVPTPQFHPQAQRVEQVDE